MEGHLPVSWNMEQNKSRESTETTLERGNGSFDLETVSFFLLRPPLEILTYPPFKYGLYPVKIEPSKLVLLLAVPVCNV